MATVWLFTFEDQGWPSWAFQSEEMAKASLALSYPGIEFTPYAPGDCNVQAAFIEDDEPLGDLIRLEVEEQIRQLLIH